MAADSFDAPEVGAQVEIRRPARYGGEADFETAVVVDRFSDSAIGVVLELQFGDAWRMQRVWPSSTIRLAS
jgi:hypothetical protein